MLYFTALFALHRRKQAEQELLELWSSVEKEKAAARERSLVQARNTKQQQRQTRAAAKVRTVNPLQRYLTNVSINDAHLRRPHEVLNIQQ